MANDRVNLHFPTPRDLVQLDRPVSVQVSPNGKQVVVLIRQTNWKENRYETKIQLWESSQKKTTWLTRSGNALQAEWVNDETVAILRSGPREEDKPQVFLFENCTGDGWQVTNHKTGVEWFHPFADGILFKAKDPERAENKPRTQRYGKFIHFEHESSASALYYTHLETQRQYQLQNRLSDEEDSQKLIEPVVNLSQLLPEPLAIQEVVSSPAGDAIYFTCRRKDDLVYLRDVQGFCLQLDAFGALTAEVEKQKAKKEKETQSPPTEEKTDKEDLSYIGRLSPLHLPKASSISAVSPDGLTLLLAHQGRDDKFFTQSDLWSIPVQNALEAADENKFKAKMHCLTADLDRDIFSVFWVSTGIFASYVDSTGIFIAKIHPGEAHSRVNLEGLILFGGIHVGAGGSIGFVGANATKFPEAYLLSQDHQQKNSQLLCLTQSGDSVKDWQLGTVETIQWKSKDGALIEGVLHKPADFDPTRKYPLAFVVHGGPRGVSCEFLFGYEDLAYYPTVQLVNQDILVLKPNYRGSAGRGQAFTELNVNNLGIGDLWDLESAIDNLQERGWVDPDRVGCMGWSQGGYISAFAGLHSDRFKAVSVGAGISDWYTYHISNDIPDFTTDYLSTSPFRGRDIYFKTAPIHNLENAKTPVLIQHGSEDQRVPISNAMELYRGLKEMGVPVTLFVYPGMGHPITKPRENHAVLCQNLSWFEHYLLDKELNLPE